MPYDPTFQARVWPIIAEAFSSSLATVWSGRLYDSVAPAQVVLPAGVYQSQDNGGVNRDTVDGNGWEGLITFRSVDYTLAGARNKLIQLSSLLSSVTHSGYDVKISPRRPLPLPVERYSQSNVYTVGLICEAQIYSR